MEEKKKARRGSHRLFFLFSFSVTLFTFRPSPFFNPVANKLALAMAAALRITLNLDGTPITSKSHYHTLTHHT
jgi:hypothetical protein